jgi:hypothetical protein
LAELEEERQHSREGLAEQLSLDSSVAGEEYDRVHSLCLDVLERMPWQAVDTLFERRLWVIWIPPGCSTIRRWRAQTGFEQWQVFLDPGLPKYPDDVARGLIAHEFAHIVLGHDAGGRENETAADDLARSWGFSGEIDASLRAAYQSPNHSALPERGVNC